MICDHTLSWSYRNIILIHPHFWRASHVSLLRFCRGTKAWQGQSMPWPRLMKRNNEKHATMHTLIMFRNKKKTKHIIMSEHILLFIISHFQTWFVIYPMHASVPCPCWHLSDSQPSKNPTTVRDSHGAGRPRSKQTYWASLKART